MAECFCMYEVPKVGSLELQLPKNAVVCLHASRQ